MNGQKVKFSNSFRSSRANNIDAKTVKLEDVLKEDEEVQVQDAEDNQGNLKWDIETSEDEL